MTVSDLIRTEARNDQGMGLTSMKERIKRLGGELEVQSSPGKGAKVSFVLPLSGWQQGGLTFSRRNSTGSKFNRSVDIGNRKSTRPSRV